MVARGGHKGRGIGGSLRREINSRAVQHWRQFINVGVRALYEGIEHFALPLFVVTKCLLDLRGRHARAFQKVTYRRA
jgi:hypothetical protein